MNDPVIKGFPTDQGTALYDFGALANVPEPLKEMPAATVGQYLVVEEVDTEGKIKKVKTVAGPDSTQNGDYILTSPNGAKWKIVVSNDGKLTAELYDSNGELMLSFSNLEHEGEQLTLVYAVNERSSENGYTPKKWLYTKPTGTGWCFMVSEDVHDNPVYLCDWDTSKCYSAYTDPGYYTHCITAEGDIVSVFRSYAICGTGSDVIEGIRREPIVYPHDDLANPVKVSFTTTEEGTAAASSGESIQYEKFVDSVSGWYVDYTAPDAPVLSASIAYTIYVFPVSPGESVTVNNTGGDRFRIAKAAAFKKAELSTISLTKIVNDDTLTSYTYTNEGENTEWLYVYAHGLTITSTVSAMSVTPITNNTRLPFSLLLEEINITNDSVPAIQGSTSLFGVGVTCVEYPVSGNRKCVISKSGGNRLRVAYSSTRWEEGRDITTGTALLFNDNEATSCEVVPPGDGYLYIAIDFSKTATEATYAYEFTISCYQESSQTIVTNHEKPCAWLQNCGAETFDGYMLMAEYTRPAIGLECHIWKVTAPYTSLAEWKIVKSFTISREYNGDLKHLHTVNYDVYGDTIYAAVGDYNDGAMLWYSKDEGESWTQLGSGERECRLLNLVFTKDYIYWATDSGWQGKHGVFRVARLANGVMDFANIEEIYDYPYVPAQQATYCTAYLPGKNMLLFLDRYDQNGNTMDMHYYDLTTGEFGTIATITSVNNAKVHLGFRCSAVSWYATAANEIVCGFGINENPCYIDVTGNTANYQIKNLVLKVSG